MFFNANRPNALKSTGPRTAVGKSFSSKNATKHGLRFGQVVIDGESEAEFDDFHGLLIDRMFPADPIEVLLVERIAVCFGVFGAQSLSRPRYTTTFVRT